MMRTAIVFLLFRETNMQGIIKDSWYCYNNTTAYKVSVFGVILVRIFPVFSYIRTEFGLNSVSLRFNPNAEKWGKNADQNNSEYGHFFCSVRSKFMLESVFIIYLF